MWVEVLLSFLSLTLARRNTESKLQLVKASRKETIPDLGHQILLLPDIHLHLVQSLLHSGNPPPGRLRDKERQLVGEAKNIESLQGQIPSAKTDGPIPGKCLAPMQFQLGEESLSQTINPRWTSLVFIHLVILMKFLPYKFDIQSSSRFGAG